MSEVTAVPLRPIRKGALVTLWVGIALVAAAGAALAYKGTAKQVAMAESPTEFLARNARKSGVVTTPSGLQYEVLEPGAGPKPQPTDMVVVEYDGKLANASARRIEMVQGTSGSDCPWSSRTGQVSGIGESSSRFVCPLSQKPSVVT